MHLPLAIKEIQAGYLSSLYFKDIYLYLAHNRLPSKKAAMKRVELLAEKYIMLDSLLFKLTTVLGKESVVLAIPEVCADKIITLYHSNLFAGHQGVIKMYLPISDRFYIPNLMHYLRLYIKRCHICQLNRKDMALPSSILLYRFYMFEISYCNRQLMWLVLLLLCGHK